jgi:hypothetical protein
MVAMLATLSEYIILIVYGKSGFSTQIYATALPT